MADLVGKTLGQYKIAEMIGKGGMATVYKATQTSLDRIVAIKVLPSYFAHDDTFRIRFVQEGRAVAKLNHPHILPVYDYSDQPEATFIVMEYVPGGTLKQTMNGPMTLNDALHIADQIGSALDYAHARGIVHRDVKPSNILMRDNENDALLTDFGLAKVSEASQALTRSGVGVGTPEYMAPEQGQGLPVDWRADLYSLGVVLYEMLTGHTPYQADTPLAIVIKHISDPLPNARTVNPALPLEVEDFFNRALAKKPSERFQKGAEMAVALRRIIAGSSGAQETPASASVIAPPQPSAPSLTPPPPLVESKTLPPTLSAPTTTTAPSLAPIAQALPQLITPQPAATTESASVALSAATGAGATQTTHSTTANRKLLALIGAVILVLIGLVGGYAIFAGDGNAPTPTPTSAPAVSIIVTPTATLAPPTPTLVSPTPTNTSAPPTATPLPPTATPVPPTATATTAPTIAVAAVPTDTPAPPPPTNTARPPTSTPLPPTATPIPAPRFSGRLAIPLCPPAPTGCNERSQVVNVYSPSGALIRQMRNATDPSFQQDGKRMLFLSKASSQDGRGEGIFFFDYTTNREERVDGAPDNTYPVFHSGGRVLFSSTRVEEGGKIQQRMFIITKFNSEQVQSVGPDPLIVLKDARFPSSRGDGLIAYFGCINGGCGIWRTDEGGHPTTRPPPGAQLTRGGSDIAPDWSPDGNQIAFISREEGTWEIYVVGAGGGATKKLTSGGGVNVAPTWNPEGTAIAYMSNRGGNWAVWVVNPNNPAEQNKLFDLPSPPWDPSNRRMDWGL